MSDSSFRQARSRILQAARRRQMSLDLSACELEELPKEIGLVTTLKSLALRSNKLRSLPTEIGLLSNLVYLDLENNLLSEIPGVVFRLLKLTFLDVRRNRLQFLPESIEFLQSLKSLYLMENSLSHLPAGICFLPLLEILDVSENQLSELPPKIGELLALKHLGLRSNKIESLPESIGNLANLATLALSRNKLGAIPACIGRLSQLRQLYLASNGLGELPAELTQLEQLQTLTLSENNFELFPPEIVRLKRLTSLQLNNNSLQKLPPELLWLEQLRRLNLSDNRLSSIPPEVGQLTGLQSLDLRNNTLRSLPLSFGRLRMLRSGVSSELNTSYNGLHLDGNPLPQPYPTLMADGQPTATSKVLSYLRGEIEHESVHADVDENEADPSVALPSVPPQGVGPHFELDDKGVIRFAPPDALDKHGNNVRRLRALHPILQQLASQLADSLSRGNSPHGDLCDRVAAYRDLVEQELEVVDFSLLYVEGVRLANTQSATRQRIDERELPSLDVSDQEAINTILSLHSTFMMSTAEGLEALADEERYNRNPTEEFAYRAAAIEFARQLQNQPNIIAEDVASVVLGAAEQIGQGSNLERSGVVGTALLKNVTVIIVTGATVALPVFGGLMLGPGGVIAGGLVGYFAGEGVKRSDAFGAAIKPLTKTIDNLSKIKLPDLIDGLATKLRPQLRLVLRTEPTLRRLAGRRNQLGWLHNALDWIHTRIKDDDQDTL